MISDNTSTSASLFPNKGRTLNETAKYTLTMILDLPLYLHNVMHLTWQNVKLGTAMKGLYQCNNMEGLCIIQK